MSEAQPSEPTVPIEEKEPVKETQEQVEQPPVSPSDKTEEEPQTSCIHNLIQNKKKLWKKSRNLWGKWQSRTKTIKRKNPRKKGAKLRTRVPNNLKVSSWMIPNILSRLANRTSPLERTFYSQAPSRKLTFLLVWKMILSVTLKTTILTCSEWLQNATILNSMLLTSMFSQWGAMTDSNTLKKSDLESKEMKKHM